MQSSNSLSKSLNHDIAFSTSITALVAEPVSRITFSIPVVLPNTHVENEAEWYEKKCPKHIIHADNQNTNDQ